MTYYSGYAQLREAGAQDDVTRKLEVQLLSQYEPEAALELAKAFQQHDAKYFTAASNLIALRLNKLNHLELRSDRLPSPEDLPVDESRNVIVPYLAKMKFNEAIMFLYAQLRENFNNPRAHINYFWVIALHGAESQILAAPDVVDQGCSVLLENTTTNERRWITNEIDGPEAGRNEFHESNPLVLALLGRRVNDLIDIPGRVIQPQQERIVEIQTKYVRLFQDVSSQFPNRFPGVTFMQTMSLGTDGNFDPTPLVNTLKSRRDHVTQLLQSYREEQVCSIHWLASRLGINELKLMKGLMADDSQEIRCVNCEPKQFDELATKLGDTRCFVLDISAIVTISSLNAWDSLDESSEYFASRTTIELLSSWIEELSRAHGGEGGTAYVTDGDQLVIQEVSPEDLRKQIQELETIFENVSKHCKIESSPRAADLLPDRRQIYIDFFGYHSLEAMCLAKDKVAVLWTDDFVVGSMVKFEFNIDRTWSQLQLKISQNLGRVDFGYFDRATAKLLGWKYINTIWNGQTLMCAGDLSAWDADTSPLNQCVQLIGLSQLPLIQKATIALEFFRRLKTASSTPSQDSRIVQVVLDSINSRSAVRWMLTVLARQSLGVLGFDHDLAICLQIWLHKQR